MLLFLATTSRLGLGLGDDLLGFGDSAAVGVGVALSGISWIGAGRRCGAPNRSRNTSAMQGVRFIMEW